MVCPSVVKLSMKLPMKWVVCVLLYAGVALHAEEGKVLIPGTPYKVHDMERPQPRIVESAGVVCIAPPSDAVVLFDGTSLDAWMSGGKEPAWEIKDGVLFAKRKYLETKEKFGAIQLHFEWKLPTGIKVHGQKGGNSGCFLMGLYEVQILQSHNNKTYPDGQAGALYGQLPPLVNVTSPQGEWNSYDITFVPPVYEGKKILSPAKVTVIHNGVVIQNGETYLGPTTHKKLASYPENHPKTGSLSFQFHGDPMEFRNIWVRPLGERDKAE